MSALADSGLTIATLLAKMTAGERAALEAQLARTNVRDKSYLDSPMGREVGRYLAAKRKELTDSSFRGWESCLDKFARQFADLSLENLELPNGADLIEPWMDERWGTSEPGTYNVNHAIIKDFFRWQVKRQRMRSNPMELVGRARKKQVYRETYTEDECRAIIASAGDLRDRIALRLLLHHGIRKGALQKVQFKHFDYARRRLTIFTKGSKVKIIPLPEPEFWTDLERHLIDVEARGDDYLMCTVKQVPYGRPDANGKRKVRAHRFPERAMGSTTMHRWWYARLNDAGITPLGQTAGKKMHTARHTAGQRVLDATGDLKLVQQFLGHASIQTTGDIYVDYDAAQVASRIADVLRQDRDEDEAE